MTYLSKARAAAWKAIKSALGFQRREGPGNLPADPGSAASIQQLSTTLSEISLSLAAMRRLIDELHGRR